MLTLEQLQPGTRIYYGGDMANQSGFGEITKAERHPRWGESVDLRLDDGREMRGLQLTSFSEEYLGHGGTRFVTLEAYRAWKAKYLAAIRASIPR